MEDIIDCLAPSTESEKVKLPRCLNGLDKSAKVEVRCRIGDILDRPAAERSFMAVFAGVAEPSASAMIDKECASRQRESLTYQYVTIVHENLVRLAVSMRTKSSDKSLVFNHHSRRHIRHLKRLSARNPPRSQINIYCALCVACPRYAKVDADPTVVPSEPYTSQYRLQEPPHDDISCHI